MIKPGAAIAFILILPSAFAQTPNKSSNADIHGPVGPHRLGVDWKYYGYISSVGEPSYLFFEEKGELKQPSGHIQVWIKGLSESRVNKIVDENPPNQRLIDESAKKVAVHYSPPVSAVLEVDPATDINPYTSVITWEVIANLWDLQPTVSMLEEIDCQHRMVRSLALTIFGRRPSTRTTPQKWEYPAPETNIGYLTTIICGHQ
jgi:hypothetical protein